MMKAYDKCPPKVREALANAYDNYVPQPVLTKFRRHCSRGKWPTEADTIVAEMVNDWSAQEAEEHWYRMNRLLNKNVDYFVPIRRNMGND